MFIHVLKKGQQPGVYVPLRALFLVAHAETKVQVSTITAQMINAFLFTT